MKFSVNVSRVWMTPRLVDIVFELDRKDVLAASSSVIAASTRVLVAQLPEAAEMLSPEDVTSTACTLMVDVPSVLKVTVASFAPVPVGLVTVTVFDSPVTMVASSAVKVNVLPQAALLTVAAVVEDVLTLTVSVTPPDVTLMRISPVAVPVVRLFRVCVELVALAFPRDMAASVAPEVMVNVVPTLFSLMVIVPPETVAVWMTPDEPLTNVVLALIAAVRPAAIAVWSVSAARAV